MYGLIISKEKGQSQYRQLYEQLREQIISGAIAPSSKLVSTRELATELKLSRSIVLEVIDQLKVEGFLETKHGSGTFVVPDLSMRKGYSIDSAQVKTQKKQRLPELSFIAGMPALDLFPRRAWNKAYMQSVEYASSMDFSYNHPKGRFELREALCDYLYRTRGINTTASQIFVTAGSAQALAILAELKENGSIILEDPCAGFIVDIFKSRSLKIQNAEVDEEGLVSESLNLTNQDFLYVSPSHQYPLGGTLPAKRRVDILKKAERSGTLIIEDDYDGEYRFDSRPIAPIQVLAPEKVIYIGTFSKILSPALRMGYMVVPQSLIASIMERKKRWDLLNEGMNQMAMTRFINEGHIYRHLRKALKHYRETKSGTEGAVKAILGDDWQISGNTTGLHLVLRLRGYDFSREFRDKMIEKEILFEPVTTYSRETANHKDKLVLGYGHRTVDEISKALAILKEITSS